MPQFELTISVDDRGHMILKGPIEDVVRCYGMMELAKDAIRRNAEAKKASRIQIADRLPPTQLSDS